MRCFMVKESTNMIIGYGKRMVKGLFSKMPLLLLAILYITLILVEKKVSAVYPSPREQYINNNHLSVSKLGEGSICVHGQQQEVNSDN